MLFPRLVFSLSLSLFIAPPLGLASVIRERDATAEDSWYRVDNGKEAPNVYSNLPPEKHITWHKVADNEHGGVFSNVPTPTKRGVDAEAGDEVSRRAADVPAALSPFDVTVAWEVMQAHPDPANVKEHDLVERNIASQDLVNKDLVERAWSDTFARCIICMAQCYTSLHFDPGLTNLAKLNLCFPWCSPQTYCIGRAQSHYRHEFNSNFAPEEQVMQAWEQIYMNYNG